MVKVDNRSRHAGAWCVIAVFHRLFLIYAVSFVFREIDLPKITIQKHKKNTGLKFAGVECISVASGIYSQPHCYHLFGLP